MAGVQLTSYDLERYDRQLMFLHEEGQAAIKGATVVVAGVGGLGSPVSLYLAVAGVGRIRLIDCDVVDLSNLNRQVMHWDRDIGRGKVESASEKLMAVNPSVTVEARPERITEDNVIGLVEGADVIVDCLDNFDTRYVVNSAAFEKGIPFVHAGVSGMEALMTTFVPGETGCLRCLYPSGPPPEKFPVLGATPGLAAMVQVMEVVKLLTGVGQPLKNRLFVFDGEGATCMELKMQRNPHCPDC